MRHAPALASSSRCSPFRRWRAPQQVQIEVKPQLRAGERGTIAVTPPVAAARFTATLDHERHRAAGRARPRACGRARALGPCRPPVTTRARSWSPSATATVLRYDLKFDAVVADTMKLGYTREHLDLEAHTLEFTMSRPAGHAELKVIGDDGTELATASADYHGERAGTWLAIHWSPARAGNVLALELRASSSDGARAGVRLVPWSVRIPHDEVVFETGKCGHPSVGGGEARRELPARSSTRSPACARPTPICRSQLFIAGHTDTVGSAADNRKLSLDARPRHRHLVPRSRAAAADRLRRLRRGRAQGQDARRHRQRRQSARRLHRRRRGADGGAGRSRAVDEALKERP